MKQLLKRPMESFALVLMVIVWIVYFITAITDAQRQRESLIVLSLASIVIVVILYPLFKRNRKHGELLGLLHYYCSPYAFIMEAKKLLEKEQEKKLPNDKNRLLL